MTEQKLVLRMSKKNPYLDEELLQGLQSFTLQLNQEIPDREHDQHQNANINNNKFETNTQDNNARFKFDFDFDTEYNDKLKSAWTKDITCENDVWQNIAPDTNTTEINNKVIGNMAPSNFHSKMTASRTIISQT